MQKCAKCKADANGSIIVEGGVSYPFCNECSSLLETFPVPTNILHTFLTEDQRMSQEDKNIFEARKRRLKGKSLWKNNI
jgi:hypothetical protein